MVKESGKIDRLDMKILSQLDLNARQGISSIASKISKSKQLIKYRIKRLENLGIIIGSYTIIDTSRIGYQIFRIYLSLQNINPKMELEMKEYLKKDRSVGWLVTLEGEWDMAILIWSKNNKEFQNFENKFMYIFGKYIRQRRIALVTSIDTLSFIDKKISQSTLSYRYGNSGKNASVDDIDIDILKTISNNCMKTNLEIAQKAKLSAKTVSLRIKKLVKEGIIQGYKIRIDIKKLGYAHYKVFLDLKKTDEKQYRQIIEYIKMSEGVIYITKAIGMADIEFEILCKSVFDFYEFMIKLRTAFSENILKYESVTVINEENINYFPNY